MASCESVISNFQANEKRIIKWEHLFQTIVSFKGFSLNEVKKVELSEWGNWEVSHEVL